MAHNSAPLDAKRGKNAFNGTHRRTIKSRISKMLQLEQINKIIDQAIEAVGFSREPELLYAPLKYILDLGGKRLRPRFCLTTYNLFKENISEEIIKPALALEIFHNFTLIHDDIMDNAALRRGMPTVYKKWNNNVAILSGDAMCIESYRFLNQAPPDKLAQIGPLFSKTALQVCEGQQFDMDFEEMESVPMEDYIKMIGLKTAVLIACAAKMGAILGDASPSICDQIYDFGYQTAVVVRENKSPLGERMIATAIANGFLMEDGEKRSEKGSQTSTKFEIPDFPSQIVEDVLKTIRLNRKAKYSWLADNLGVSEATIKRAIADLKELGYINSEHSKIKGEWQLLK